MPKRRKDPITGEPQLTYREQMLVDEFIGNGGNGAQAAAAAGYKAARLDQAAYQALHRDCVQQHIHERIRESRVSSDEVIGTLVSNMRGNAAEFFDEYGNFSIEIARQKGIGHLIKSISGIICDPPDREDQQDQQDQEDEQDRPDPDDLSEPEDATNGGDSGAHLDTEADTRKDAKGRYQPDHTQSERANLQTCNHCGGRPSKRSNPPTRKRRTAPRPPSFRFQLHSPLQAASILARLIGIDRHHPYRPINQPPTSNLQRATNRDFDPNALLQSLIDEQMKEHGLSREAVINRILQVRPEFAKYLDELPPPPRFLDQLSLRDTGKLLAPILDAIAFLKANVSNPTSEDRVLDAYHQMDAAISVLTSRPGDSHSTRSPSPDLPDINLSTLPRPNSAPTRPDHTAPIDPDPASCTAPDSGPDALDAADPAAKSLGATSHAAESHGAKSDDAKSDDSNSDGVKSHDALTAAIHRVIARLSEQERARLLSHLESLSRQKEANSVLTEPHPPNALRQAAHPPSDHPPSGHPDSAPTQNRSANLQLSTFNPQPTLGPAALDSFRRTYAGITRPIHFGLLDNHFTEVIDRIMRDQSLTPQQAVDAIWLAARQSTWSSANLIDTCIADYAALHPRLAHAQPPVRVQRPPSPPRYYRPASSATSPASNLYPPQLTDDSDHSDDSDDSNYSSNPKILTSTQLFSPGVRPPPARTCRDD